MKRIVRTLALGSCAVLTLTGCGDSGGSTQAFCDTMQDLEDNDPTAGTAEGSEEFFDASIGAMEQARDAAPDEIKDDVEAMLGAFEQLREINPEELSVEELNDLGDEFSSIEENSDRVNEFIESNCDE